MKKHPIGREGHQAGLVTLAERLRYRNGPTPLLKTAFTHTSYANEVLPRPAHNERLEFLGDSVLDLVIAEALMARFPEAPEGELHRVRTTLVRTEGLADRARDLEIGRLIRLGKGELLGRGRDKDSLLANAYEAMVGAVFLDQGYDAVRLILLDLFEDAIAATRLDNLGIHDPKSRLQEQTQQTHGTPPSYTVVDATGPEHEKVFHVEVSLGARVIGTGRGRSKKQAEREAARSALAMFEAD